MTTHWQKTWLLIMVAACIVLAISSPSQGETNTTDELGGATGKYNAQTAAPDNLTTTKQGKDLKVTSGTAAPDRLFDQGLVRLTEKNDATAKFEGRSTNWGCVYTVKGVYVGTGVGTSTAWANTFEEQTMAPHIVLEINDGGTCDDVMPLGKPGTLHVWVLGTTGSVDVNLSATPTGIVSGLSASESVTAGETTPTNVTLTGQAGGQTTITASATVDGQTISSSITVNVLNFCGKITFDDEFNGRSRLKLGVGETGSLGVELGSGTTLADLAPDLEWTKTPETAKFSLTNINKSAGTANFTAGDVREEVTLTLTDKNGNKIAFNLTVIPPNDIFYKQVPGTGIKHTQGVASVGFKADWYYRPTDVSFHYIQCGEGSCNAYLDGWFKKKFPQGLVHSANGPYGIGTGDITKGCVALPPPDRINAYNPTPPAYETGYYTWDIPQRWRLGNGNWHVICEKQHRADIDASGKKTIQKGGVGPFSKNLNDPSSSY